MLGSVLVIEEYTSYGSQLHYLRGRHATRNNMLYTNQPTTSLPYRRLVSFAYQVAHGMEHLASKKVAIGFSVDILLLFFFIPFKRRVKNKKGKVKN